MISEAQIDAQVKALFENITFPGEPEGLYAPLIYMIEGGGKRLRPSLCLLTYSLFSDRLDDSILEPAAGLEVFHTFTLIHDDIMDNSTLRRGRPTVWTKWGNDGAILSGDVMCIDSYRRISKAPRTVLDKVLELFNTTAAEVCEGQQYDMDFEHLTGIGMSDYIKMIGLKTAVLIACAAKMGAIMGGADDATAGNLYDYAYNLGLAFQIADDYLDAFGDEKTFGKPIGGDILNRKMSWLTIHAMERDADRMEAAFAMPGGTDGEKAAKIATVKGIYTELGVDRAAKSEIKRLTEEALAIAREAVPEDEPFERLRKFADRLVGRKY